MILNLFLEAANPELVLWLLLVPLGLIFILMIVALVIRIVKMTQLNNRAKLSQGFSEQRNKIYDVYGGFGNITSINHEMSRITVEVVDLELIDAEGLKNLGATGILITGNTVKASFGNQAEDIFNIIKL